MKKTRLVLVAALCVSLAAALFALTACQGGEGGGGGDTTTVAATVNGTEIMEQKVTDQIEAMRAQSGSADDPALWAQALAGANYTPETLRASVIDSMVQEIVLTQEAEAQGITVDDEEIDALIAQTRETVGATDDDVLWLSTLQQYGYQDEQAYRDMLVTSELTNKLYEGFEVEPTDAELTEFIAQNPTIVEGFTLPAADAAAAPEAPAEEAAAPEAPAEGEEAPAEGEAPADAPAIPEPVTVDPASIKLSDIPEDVLAQFTEQWELMNKGVAFQNWMLELVEAADVVVNDMPEDVPYNVDMSLAESDSATDPVPDAGFSSPEAVSSAIAEGLIIEDDVVGTGAEAVPGATVHMHYVGTLEDGTEFDSNGEGDTPFSFVLGTGSVIKGWDAGVVGMKVGGTRTLTIPSSLAYGPDGNPPKIPADATLHFTVELVEVEE